MRKINSLIILLVLCFLGACSEDAIESLDGKYDLDRYQFDEVTQEPTEKLQKGVKLLKMKLSDGTNSLVLGIGSNEWVLQEGTYSPTATVAGNNQYSAVLNGSTIAVSGDLDISLLEKTYYINGLLSDASGNRFKVDYKGALSFEIGEDDPESSGYVAILSTSMVVIYDANWQPVVYPDVTKYTFTLTDPDGNDAGSFDAVNVNNAETSSLAGTYTIQGNSTDPWLMDNGWVVPDYGMAGGSYYVDSDGTKQYITGGTVTVSAVEGINGDILYSFSGTGLTTSKSTGETGTGSFNIKFATLLQSTGIELRDMVISSSVLGKDMKYSIYLPKSYDGTKSYPVLYLLHGYGGNNNDWLTDGLVNPYASSAAASGTAPEMIVVCPDGMNTFYCNGFQDGMQYMTYFFDEFLPFIESTYKVKAERGSRAIGGLSMGGFGSLYYGLLHPDMFCHVYACSPAAYADGAPNLFEMMYQVAPADMPGITIETGTEDSVVGEGPGMLYGTMGQCGIACEYIARAGVHDWAFWKACTPKIITKAGSVFQ